MTCDRWRESISALADGETPVVDAELVDRHIRRCGDCASFLAFVTESRRRSRLSEAPAIFDLAPRIVKAHVMSERLTRWTSARAALAVVAVEILVLSIPGLLGDEPSVSIHAARHLGAFSVAYAVALIVAVVRPTRARTVLPVAVVLAATLVITALIDVVHGHAPLIGEAAHLPELVSVALVWLLARPSPTGSSASATMTPPTLRIVDEERRTG